MGMEQLNLGARLLLAALGAESASDLDRGAQAEVAARLSVSSGRVSEYLRGVTLPSRQTAAAIWRAWGVPPDAWDKQSKGEGEG